MRFFFTCFLALVSTLLGAPKVSIITPLSNAEPFLESYLEDITRQTIFDQCELILVQGGDVSRTEALIGRFCERFSNVQLKKLPKTGTLYRALNEGIKSATGKYVYFAAVDNRLNRSALEQMSKALDGDRQIDGVYADYIVTEKPFETFEDNTHQWTVTLEEYAPYRLDKCLTGPQPMWRKELHEHFGLFREDFTASGNWEFWNRVAQKGATLKKIDGYLTLYYWNPDGITTSNQEEIRRVRERENDWIISQYSKCWKKEEGKEKPFVFVIPSYKNRDFYEQNLNSVFAQNYTNFRVIYVDDASPDGTGDLVEAYVKKHHLQEKVTLIKNENRCGALANVYKAIHLCKPDEIVATLDGDDWLSHNDVLTHLNEIYADPAVWLTYGQYAWFFGEGIDLLPGGCKELPEYVRNNNGIREYLEWVTSQLRTFYAGLFHQIKKEDLFYQGEFFKMAADIAYMIPLVEMAGSHTRFNPEITYIYNRTTPINDDKVNRQFQLAMDLEIRSRKKYEPVFSYKTSFVEEAKKKVYVTTGLWGDLFAEGDPIYDRDHGLRPMCLLRETLKERNVELHQTHTLEGLDDGDLIVCFDVPSREQLKALMKYPKEKRVVFLWEPGSVVRDNQDGLLHEYFDKIYTWDDSLIDNKRYFKFRYPRCHPMIEDLIPFEKKKLLCAISCNKTSSHSDELYSERVKSYRYFDRCGADFDLYGRGWHQAGFACYRGEIDWKVDTLKQYKFCLCYENIRDQVGYITEKIFDAFEAGCIPIYWGALNILDEIPEECFIDRRLFESEAALYEYIYTMSEETYAEKLESIKKYLSSTRALAFSEETFVRKVASSLSPETSPYYFCTGSNAGYFDALLNLIGGIHQHHFDQLGEIAVFDLGLEEEQIEHLKTIQKVAVFSVEKTHPDLLTPFQTTYWGKMVPGWYAWKPVCIHQALSLYPDVLWIDAGTTLFRPIDPIFSTMRKEGYFFHNGCDWSVRKETTEFVVQNLGLNQAANAWILEDTVQGLESGLMGITPAVERSLINPMYKMTKDLRHFADDGTTPGGFGQGRHEQTLLSILALQNSYKIHHHFLHPLEDMHLTHEGYSVPFHISCNETDCKPTTHIYCSRKQFDASKTYPHIRYIHD